MILISISHTLLLASIYYHYLTLMAAHSRLTMAISVEEEGEEAHLLIARLSEW